MKKKVVHEEKEKKYKKINGMYEVLSIKSTEYNYIFFEDFFFEDFIFCFFSGGGTNGIGSASDEFALVGDKAAEDDTSLGGFVHRGDLVAGRGAGGM